MEKGRPAHSTPSTTVVEELKNIYNQAVRDNKGSRFTLPLTSSVLENAAVASMLGLRVPGFWLFCNMISPRDEAGVAHAHFTRL